MGFALSKNLVDNIKLKANAYENYERRNYKLALKNFNKLISFDSSNGDFYLSRGKIKNELKKYKEALHDIDKAIELFIEQPDKFHIMRETGCFFFRGLTQCNLKQFKEALCDFKEALKIDFCENTFPIRFYIGQCHYLLKEYEEAEEQFDEVIGCYEDELEDDFETECFPNESIYYWRGLTLLFGSKDYEYAEKDLIKAIELNSNIHEYFFYRGYCAEKQKKYEEAIYDYSQSIELNPKNSESFHQRGNCLTKLEKYKEANEDFIKSNALQKEKE